MLQPDPHVLREAMRRTITAGKAAVDARRDSHAFSSRTLTRSSIFSFPFFSLFLSFFPQRPRQPTHDCHDHVRRGRGRGRSHSPSTKGSFSFTRPVHNYHPLHYPTPTTPLAFSYHLCCRRNSCSPSCTDLGLSVFIVVHLSVRRTRICDLCRHQQVLATAHRH